MKHAEEFLKRLATEPAVWVMVQDHRGSVPREAGAWMAVFAQGSVGTVGGGQMEWVAMAQARDRLTGQAAEASGNTVREFTLGPSMGQCCGGAVSLRFERVTALDLPRLEMYFAELAQRRPAVALFGGGHVGQALVAVMANLPWQVRWFDSRDPVFPTDLPANVVCEHSDPLHRAVATLAPHTAVLVMSHSHAEDLEVVAACLNRHRQQADMRFVGLIGSRTKGASFDHRLQARGFTAQERNLITCPIGLPGITDKTPEVIAVAVAAQLLQMFSQPQSTGANLTKDC